METDLRLRQPGAGPEGLATYLRPRQPTRQTFLAWLARALRRNKGLLLGAILVAFPLVGAVAAPALAPHSPRRQDLRVAELPPSWVEGGRAEYALGTDYVGRDVLSQLIYGGRVSLTVGFGGVALAILIGLTLGLLAGYFGGWFDVAIMGVVDIQLSIPYLLLVVTVAGVLGPSLLNVILIFGVTDYPLFTRMVRGEVLRLRDSGFVEAAQAVGAGQFFIIVRHLIPNLLGVIITVGTFEMAAMILYEAGLGFLGLSVPPTTPSWGNMLAIGRNYLATSWWLATFAGLAIMLTTFGVNLLGDWLRDVLDPHQQ
jgi:ABC-type dipeptide/oligopeptide/nickel transport system permease subunit